MYQSLSNLINNLRSNVSKNALTLTKEIFSVNSIKDINHKSTVELCNRLIEKSISDKSFLKSEAKLALK